MIVRHRAFSALACLGLALPQIALSQVPPAAAPATPAKPLGTCEGLALDWKSVEYELADNYAEGVTDNSAPRATMRAGRDQIAMHQAQIALNLMRDHKCALPKRAPSGLTYSLNALKCRNEKLKENYKSAECDRSTWTRFGL